MRAAIAWPTPARIVEVEAAPDKKRFGAITKSMTERKSHGTAEAMLVWLLRFLSTNLQRDVVEH